MSQIVLKCKRLQVYQSLEGRMGISQSDKMKYYNEKQGFEGEKKLERWVKAKLQAEHIPLYGLLLENQGSLFQIDCILIFQKNITMIEIKNFQGEFEFRENRLYSITKNKYYQHPLHQLQRSDTNLRELLNHQGINASIQSYVFFVHDEFTLFTERNPTIVLPTQIHSFIRQLNQIPGKMYRQHHKLAEKLMAQHIEESLYMQLPDYSYPALRKGIFCPYCREAMNKNKQQLFCQKCGYKESIDSGVLRNVIEFNILFPYKKMTTRNISDWCADVLTDRTIRNILRAYLQHYSKNLLPIFYLSKVLPTFFSRRAETTEMSK